MSNLIASIARFDVFTWLSVAGAVVFCVVSLCCFLVCIVWRKKPKYDGLHDDRYDITPQFPDIFCGR